MNLKEKLKEWSEDINLKTVKHSDFSKAKYQDACPYWVNGVLIIDSIPPFKTEELTK